MAIPQRHRASPWPFVAMIGMAGCFFLYAVSGEWAVGTAVDADSGNNLSLVERRAGNHWITVPSPDPGQAAKECLAHFLTTEAMTTIRSRAPRATGITSRRCRGCTGQV